MDKWIRAFRWTAFVVILGLLGFAAPAAETAASTPSTIVPPSPAQPSIGLVSTIVPPNAALLLNSNGPTTNLDASIRTVVAVQELIARQADETLRSHLRLQEQLHSALLAIQVSRAEASVEAQTNVGAMLSRMAALEQELAGQRARDAETARHTNRLMMLAAGGIFFVGMLAMVLTVVIQARGMNRLAEIAVGLSHGRGLPGIHEPLSLGLPSIGGDRLLLGAAGAGPGTGDDRRLQSAIRQLDDRIRGIEGVARATPDSVNGNDGFPPDKATGARTIVLAKAQAHMNLGQSEIALKLLDDAIAQAPTDAEFQLRRGMVLERLKHLDPAIEAYDRAISIDARCTQAYLFKGGVLNQQSRYQEALACYERALESTSHAG